MFFNNPGEHFPYTNFHDLNLDWIVRVLKEMDEKIDKASMSAIQIADPIQWDITKQYEALTVVMDNGNAYLSMQPVPYGVSINNTDYWQEIFDIGEVFASLKEAIAVDDDGNSPTSSKNRAVGSLVWLEDELYQVISAITLGDTYSAENVEKVSVEELIDNLKDVLSTIQSSITTLTNTKWDNRLRGKTIAIYGDSYSASPRGLLWQPIINAVTGTTCHVSAQGSLSLPEIYSTKWDNYNADIYIIQAGLNDLSKDVTGNEFMSAISNFCTAIRTVNSNAEIYFVTPPDIPYGDAHNHLFPFEFYRQCYWHLMSRYHYHVIDALKWQELKFSDNVHPTDATAPLIGKYIIESLLIYGDDFNCRSDYSKLGRNNTQILFMMDSGEPYLYIQNLEVTDFAFDGSAVVDISQASCDIQARRIAFIDKNNAVYQFGLLMVSGGGTVASPNRLIVAIDGATSEDTKTVSNGWLVPFHPSRWIKDLG